MGHAKDRKQSDLVRAEFRKTIPARACKAFLGVLLSPIWLMIALGYSSWNDNKWPWE